MKLNLGSGDCPIEGYENIDLKNGLSAYPLSVKDNSVDEIRASHLLEHFSHREVFEVLKNWVSKLKVGGVLKIAVPDFDKLVALYKEDNPYMTLYLMGGQTDENDYHKSIFNKKCLKTILKEAGLLNIKEWKSEIQDCASLPVSLNLQGEKSPLCEEGIVSRKLAAVMSMPRITFTDTFTCVMQHIIANGIPFMRSSGVFWGQCLTRMIETMCKKDIDYLMTIDYDTWFTYDDVLELVAVLERNPEYDAVMPVQIKRESESPLASIVNPKGGQNGTIPLDYLDNEIVPAASGHFGLTVFRKGCFEKIKKPWFIPKPDAEGGWEAGRTDEDIMFWKNFKKAGCKLGLSTEVKVGHLQLMVTYPGKVEEAWKPEHIPVSVLEK